MWEAPVESEGRWNSLPTTLTPDGVGITLTLNSPAFILLARPGLLCSPRLSGFKFSLCQGRRWGQ
jgi:hypothetical protein